MTLFFHGAKNLLRNKRRTVMGLTVLASALIIMFVTNAYTQGLYRILREMFIRGGGVLQIYKAEGESDGTTSLIAKSEAEALHSFVRTMPELSAVVEQIYLVGLLGTASQSDIAMATGVSPEVRDKGALSTVSVVKGRWLSEGEEDTALLGEGLASNLEVSPGDWLNFLGTTVDGAMNPVSVQVKGVVSTGNRAFDNRALFFPLELARSVLASEDRGRLLVFPLGQISDEEIAELRMKIEDEIGKKTWALEVRQWDELRPMYGELKRFYDFIFRFVLFVVTLLVLIAVFEFISIAFLERMREMGSLRAIGHTKGDIFLLLISEVLSLFVVALAVGIPLGLVIAKGINVLEIPYTPPGATKSYPFYLDISVRHFVGPAMVIFGSSFMAAIFPAIKTARLRVVEVLHHE